MSVAAVRDDEAEAIESDEDEALSPAPPHALVPAEALVRKLRPHRARARTESITRLSKRALERDRQANPTPEGVVRPVTRADCLPGGSNEMRPCPFAGCRWHLAIDVNEDTGSIKHNQPDREVWEMTETCAWSSGGCAIGERRERANAAALC